MDSNISRVAEIVIEVFVKAAGVGHGYDWIRLAKLWQIILGRILNKHSNNKILNYTLDLNSIVWIKIIYWAQ